jgi:hypothetical protein
VLDEAVAVLADQLGWDATRQEAEIADYRGWLDHLTIPDAAGPRSETFGAGVAVGSAR